MPEDADTKAERMTVSFGNGGIQLPWKIVVPVLAVLAAGGSLGGIRWFGGGVAAAPDRRPGMDDRIAERVEETLGAQVETNTATLEEHGRILGEVQFSLEAVASTQQRQVARDEARRATEDIANRTRREREYDRLLEKNLARLARGLDPCGSVECSE